MEPIRIDSILGGESLMTNFAAKDQFNQSLGIDPAYPLDTAVQGTNSVVQKASGLLRPVGSTKFTGTTLTAAPLWQISNPKDALVYVYDLNGSAYSISPGTPSITALSDAGVLSNGLGGFGSEYYDNYIYYGILNDLVRYGPLNGVPTFSASYWQGTLGLTALATPTPPPIPYNTNLRYPAMVLHRHSDGKMYILHSTGGQGAVSFVSTTKGSVEGDTNNGSTFGKLLFGYGLMPLTVASYGSGLAISLFETSGIANHNKNRAKLAFWDTTSQNFNNMLWDEFPDELITALKNVNGVLYIWSGNYGQYGCRVSRYVGGNSIKEIAYYESAIPPMQGAVDGSASNVIFGSTTDVPEQAGAVYSLGLHKGGMSSGAFKTMRATGAGSSVMVTSLGLNHYTAFSQQDPWVGWSNGSAASGTTNGIDKASDDCSVAPVVWQSQTYKIGVPFNIARVRIPLAQTLATGMTVTAKIYFDNKTTSKILPTIDSTTFIATDPASNFGRVANIRTDNTGSSIGRGESNFMIELRWTGTTLCTVDLPITAYIDIIPD